MDNKIFFSDNGLTSTSANHICNIAKEYLQTKNKLLESISFVNANLSVIGSDKQAVVELGTNDISWIEQTLDEIGQVNSLVAWLREAIKAKDEMTKELLEYSFIKYVSDNNIELPAVHNYEPLTEAEYYNSLSLKDRNAYYHLETLASVIGKHIHPGGHFATARERLKDKILNPTSVDKNGRDTLIYGYSPSIDQEQVDELYFKLQDKHRSIQAQLNKIRHECETAISDSELECEKKHREEYDKYTEAKEKAASDYKIFVNKKRDEIKKLKIIIPDSLKGVYEMLNSIGKNK